MVEQVVDRRIKQSFLISEIKDQGYDLDNFSDYMMSLKDHGANVDVWTIQELSKAVNDYKNQPYFVFKRNPRDYTNSMRVEETSSLNFKIQIQATGEIFYRSYKQIEDTCQKLIKENPYIYFAKPFKQKVVTDPKTNRILQEYLDLLKVSLEHLYANRGLLDSKLCTAFFCEDFESFDKTLSTYNISQSALKSLYKNFNATNFKKILQTPSNCSLPTLPEVQKFPEHIESYMKYLDKYLEKNETIWNRYANLFSQLQINLKATSDTYLKLGEVTIELYHQIDKLNTVINHKEEGLKKIFIEINKYFYDSSMLIRLKYYGAIKVSD